jgi:hypothetical protein
MFIVGEGGLGYNFTTLIKKRLKKKRIIMNNLTHSHEQSSFKKKYMYMK